MLIEWTRSNLVKIAHLGKNAVGGDMSEKARRMGRSSHKRNQLIVYQIGLLNSLIERRFLVWRQLGAKSEELVDGFAD